MKFLSLFDNYTLSLSGDNLATWRAWPSAKGVRKLHVSSTSFDDFPLEHFVHLRELTFLWVRFSQFPSEIFKMKQLRSLSFVNVDFSEFPEQICGMKHLEKLAVRGAGLTQIPDSLAQLKNLREVDFGCNQLQGFEVDLRAFRRLQWFLISDNPLQKLPSALPANTYLGLAGTSFLQYNARQFKAIPH